MFSYSLKKNTISLSTSYSDSNYQLSGDTEIKRRMNIEWTWNLFPRTRSTLNISWNKVNFRQGRDERYLIVEYGLSHIISPGLDASIGARFVDKKSNNPIFNFEENRIFANLNKRF